MPTVDSCTLLLDCGANTDCKSEYLVQFAMMGTAYMKRVLGVENPRVGLLNNGAEEEKGNELTKQTYQLLKKRAGTLHRKLRRTRCARRGI